MTSESAANKQCLNFEFGTIGGDESLSKSVPFRISIISKHWREWVVPPLCSIPVKWRHTRLVTRYPAVVNPMPLVFSAEFFHECHGLCSAKRIRITQKLTPITDTPTPKHPPDVFVKAWVRMHVNGITLADAIVSRLQAQVIKVGDPHGS
jgi:hypothetical protein